MSDFPPTPAPVTRKKRYYFQPGDDLLMLQTVLNERDIFCLGRARRVAAWDVITESLNRQGIFATTHSMRCRLTRLVETFQEGLMHGKQSTSTSYNSLIFMTFSYDGRDMTLLCLPFFDADFTPLEQLLDQYSQAEAHFEQSKLASKQKRGQATTERYSRLSVGSRRSSFGSEFEEDSPTAITTVQPVSIAVAETAIVAPSITSMMESTLEGNQPRKKRFYFKESHDVVLLKAMLADEGIILPSGVRKPAWKNIEAVVNSQGMDVKAHTIRTHLRLMLETHRREESTWDMDQFELSDRQKLLRAYCKKMDEEEQQNQGGNDDQSFEPTPEAAVGNCDDYERHSVTNSPQTVTPSAESVESTRSDMPTDVTEPSLSTAQDDGVVTSTTVSRTRDAVTSSTEISVTAPTPSATQSSPAVQARGGIVNSIRASDVASTLPNHHAPSAPDAETREVAEPASKRQRLQLEVMLESFITEQNERQEKQHEHERARLSEQQDLQRQTIDLQKRSLDIQEKAMNMQERLMALMEKVMDKLN